MKKIKSIIFDLGGVLLNISYRKTITEFDRLGVKNSSLFYSKRSQKKLFNLLETGEISEINFIDAVKKECTNATSNEIRIAWNSMLLDLPQKRIAVLKNLKFKYKLYLLSNTNVIHIQAFKDYLGKEKYTEFLNLFDKVYYSHEIGFRKPDPESFNLILEENDLIARQVLFIDDSDQHIVGAKNLGIQTHHLTNGQEISNLFSDIIQ